MQRSVDLTNVQTVTIGARSNLKDLERSHDLWVNGVLVVVNCREDGIQVHECPGRRNSKCKNCANRTIRIRKKINRKSFKSLGACAL